MKKRNKRLALHRETLRNLEERGLRRAVGGAQTYDYAGCATSCLCLDDQGTFSSACTTICPTTSNG